jgi:hypothetical protein
MDLNYVYTEIYYFSNVNLKTEGKVYVLDFMKVLQQGKKWT